jgi:hypothetical protein
MLHIRFVRIEASYLRARAALLMAASGHDRHRHRFLSIARGDVRRMRRLNTPWSNALSLLVDAGALFLEGSREQSEKKLAMAADAFDAVHMKLYAGGAPPPRRMRSR